MNKIIINGSVLAEPVKKANGDCYIEVAGISGTMYKNGNSTTTETVYSITIPKEKAQSILENVHKGYCAKIIKDKDQPINSNDVEFWADDNQEVHA